MLLTQWLLEDSPAAKAGIDVFTQNELDWFMIQCWNLAKRMEALNLTKHASTLHQLTATIVMAMKDPTMDQLRRAALGAAGAAGHALIDAENVRCHRQALLLFLSLGMLRVLHQVLTCS